MALAGSAAAMDGRISGHVRTDGEALDGAMVTARAVASGIETTVFSGDDGAYYLGSLDPGTYEVEAKIPGRSAPRRTLAIGGGEIARADFQAVPASDYRRRLSSAHWLSLLPDGEMKREFLLNCTSCHEISYGRVMPGEVPRTSAGWLDAITLMRSIDVYGLTPPDFDDERYAAWLAEHLDARHIAELRPGTAAKGAVLAARITEYPVPETPSLPHDIAIGPDGRVWITAFYNNVVWAIVPGSGETQSYAVNESPERMGQVRALTFDRDGMLWVLLGGTESVVRLNPTDGAIETFHVGLYPHSIEVDSAGKLWFNDYFSATERIGSIDPATGKVTLYQIPTAGLTPQEGLPLLYGLQVDRDDIVWGTMLAANKLFRFDSRGGGARLFEMPHVNSGPRRLGIGPDGTVWIPEFNTGTLTRFAPETKAFTRHSLGFPSLGPYDVAVDQNSGHVWVTAALGSMLLRFDPATAVWDRYPLPTEPAYPRHIAIDGSSGDVWTTYSSMPDAVPKIVRIELRAKPP